MSSLLSKGIYADDPDSDLSFESFFINSFNCVSPTSYISGLFSFVGSCFITKSGSMPSAWIDLPLGVKYSAVVSFKAPRFLEFGK